MKGWGWKIKHVHWFMYNTTDTYIGLLLAESYKQVQSVHNFLPSDTTWRSEAHCRTMSCHTNWCTCTLLCNVVTLVDSHCTKQLRTELHAWFERGQIWLYHNGIQGLFLQSKQCSVNPPGCHRLHKPIVGKIIGPHTCHGFHTCSLNFIWNSTTMLATHFQNQISY